MAGPDVFTRIAEAGGRAERATKRHAREMGRVMRRKDVDESRATGNFTPEGGVRMSLNNSTEAYAVYAGDDLLAVFGVGPMHNAPGVHVVWAMTSVHVERHALTFWRCSKAAVEYLRDRYEVMLNMIHSKYPEAMTWAQRLGFKVSADLEKFGLRGDLFARAVCYTPKIEVVHV